MFYSEALPHSETKNNLLTFLIRLHYEWQMLETEVKIIISCTYWLNSCYTQSLRKNQTHLTAGRMKGKDKSYPDNIYHIYHELLNSKKHQPSPRTP